MMKKSDMKWLVDCLMFVDFCSLLVVGLILAFAIPQGGGPTAPTHYFLWLHKHQWGNIHFYLAIGFLILLPIHLSFNWAWIQNTFKGYFGGNWQKALAILSVVWVGIVSVGWFLSLVR
jgi:hypothetical protein